MLTYFERQRPEVIPLNKARTVRRAHVAGRFYPEGKEALRSVIELFLKQIPKEDAVAVIAPHAGYVYSGDVAGSVYSSVNMPDSVILIGPNHTGMGRRASVMAEGEWEMPLGKLKIDEQLAKKLLGSSFLFTDDSEAHLMEHSLEVQTPFIYTLNGKTKIVPVTVMEADYGECVEMGHAIAETIKSYGKKVLIIVSSDMNHYEPDGITREKDKLAIEKVLRLDPHGLLQITALEDITMCGVTPAVIALEAAKRLGATGGTLVKYATSGEASGDFNQVVGYAGIVIR